MALAVARLKYARITPRKARLVVNLIRGQQADAARDLLCNLQKSAKYHILKTLDSCIANVKSQYKIGPSELYVSHVRIDKGPTWKRFRAQTMGRASTVCKRTSHVVIELDRKGV